MHGKEFVKSLLMSFFIVVTLVNLAAFILGTVFHPEARFGYDALLSPIIYGLCGVIPFAVMYSKKELSVKQIIFRKFLQLVFIEIILIWIAFGADLLTQGITFDMVCFVLCILVVYLLANGFMRFLEFNTAKSLTQDLKKYQEQCAKEEEESL